MTTAITGTKVSYFVGDVPTHYQQQYVNRFWRLAQQDESRLRGLLTPETIDLSGKQAWLDIAHPVSSSYGYTDDGSGNLTAGIGPRTVTARYGDTVLQYPTRARRRVTAAEFDESFLFERHDVKRALTSARSMTMREMLSSWNRKTDEVIITSLDADVKEGQENTSGTFVEATVAFPATQVVDANGETSLTVSKVANIIEKFQEQEEDTQNELPVCIISAREWKNFFGEDKFISKDYNPDAPLPTYMLREFMGCLFIRSELLTKAGDTTTCFAFMPSSMVFAAEAELIIEFTQRTDKRNRLQLHSEVSYGALRVRDTGVVKFKCNRNIVTS